MITLALITPSNIFALQLPPPSSPAPLSLLLLAVALALVGLTADVVLSASFGTLALPFVAVALGVTLAILAWEAIRI